MICCYKHTDKTYHYSNNEEDLSPSTFKSAVFSGRISPPTACSIVPIVVLLLKHFKFTVHVCEEVSTVFTKKSRVSIFFPRKSQRKTESWKSFRENHWIFLCGLYKSESLALCFEVLLSNSAVTCIRPSQHQRLADENKNWLATSKLPLATWVVSWKLSVEPCEFLFLLNYFN